MARGQFFVVGSLLYDLLHCVRKLLFYGELFLRGKDIKEGLITGTHDCPTSQSRVRSTAPLLGEPYRRAERADNASLAGEVAPGMF